MIKRWSKKITMNTWGMDVLLDFLAKSGVVNRDFKDWLVTFHMVGEDGEEFSWARKIVGKRS